MEKAPVPENEWAWKVSPIPWMAPPPLGKESLGIDILGAVGMAFLWIAQQTTIDI